MKYTSKTGSAFDESQNPPTSGNNAGDSKLSSDNITGTTATINGLASNTDYYFAVYAVDADSANTLVNRHTIKTKAKVKSITIDVQSLANSYVKWNTHRFYNGNIEIGEGFTLQSTTLPHRTNDGTKGAVDSVIKEQQLGFKPNSTGHIVISCGATDRPVDKYVFNARPSYPSLEIKTITLTLEDDTTNVISVNKIFQNKNNAIVLQ